jgi:hypothetical protein
MTAFARSFACILGLTAVLAACSTSYLDQASALVGIVRIYAYAAGGLGGLMIILSLPRMATPAPMPPVVAKAPPEAVRRALSQVKGAPVVRLKPRPTVRPAASADAPEALRARSRRLFGSAA